MSTFSALRGQRRTLGQFRRVSPALLPTPAQVLAKFWAVMALRGNIWLPPVLIAVATWVFETAPGLATMPLSDMRVHYVGELWYSVYNDGPVANGHMDNQAPSYKDCEALGVCRDISFEYPGGTQCEFLHYGGLMFGCIRGLDTLVSAHYQAEDYATEFRSYDTVRETSTDRLSRYFDGAAHSEQQYFSVYSDTSAYWSSFWHDYIENRPHKPIGIEVHQTSHAWSSGYAARFIIIDNWIVNISSQPIRQGCVGLYVSSWVHNTLARGSGGESGLGDDMLGFLHAVPAYMPGTLDTLDLAWLVDADGDPEGGKFGPHSIRGVLGVRILRVPAGGRLSYNWWGIDPNQSMRSTWGPRLLKDSRGYAGSLGEPLGDRSRYKMMTNGEIDYDQVYAGIDQEQDGWSPPLSDEAAMRYIAEGDIVEFLLSYGPLPDIAPGDSVPLTFAMIAGADFHNNARNYVDHFRLDNPKPYLDGLDFSDLVTNARWAGWLFDTPGVDTDSDGYRGKYHLTNCLSPGGPCDTVWFEGDGVPDWNARTPPPPPKFDLVTKPHVAILRWEGERCETAKDNWSHRRDFEGYKVYSSRFDVNDQYALVASWDTDDDFTRWAYKPKTNDWRQISYPLTVPQWQQVMGDSTFDPKRYPRPSFESAYRDTFLDTVLDLQGTIIEIKPQERYSYWEPQGPNRGNRFWTPGGWEDNLIQRVGQRDTVIDADTLTYGVYEITIDNLNGAIPLYFAITAFDYGDYKRNVASQESAPHANNRFGFMVYSSDVVVDSGLQVAVYPNPYKISFADPFGDKTSYYRQRYEAPGAEMTERDRRIWFVNLPDTAHIRIYTLAGDLVRDIRHPDPFLTTYPSIVGWDLVSRNTQAVVSGIYIYRVDSRLGRQVGKIVIIK